MTTRPRKHHRVIPDRAIYVTEWRFKVGDRVRRPYTSRVYVVLALVEVLGEAAVRIEPEQKTTGNKLPRSILERFIELAP